MTLMHLMMNNFLMKSMSFAYSGFNRCHCTIVCRGFEIMSCQCFVSDAPEPFLPGECKEKLLNFFTYLTIIRIWSVPTNNNPKLGWYITIVGTVYKAKNQKTNHTYPLKVFVQSIHFVLYYQSP